MGLETGSFISALVSTNPVGATDPKSQGDDHIRFIKAKLLETFPNVTGAVTATHTELNLIAGATTGLATFSVSFAQLVAYLNSFSVSVTTSDITGTIAAPLIAKVTSEKLVSGTLSASVGYCAPTITPITYSTTLTLNPLVGNLQAIVNNGIPALIPPTVNCTMVVQMTNNASATVATTSSFTKVTGSSLTNTNGDDFFLTVTKIGSFTHLHVQALQ